MNNIATILVILHNRRLVIQVVINIFTRKKWSMMGKDLVQSKDVAKETKNMISTRWGKARKYG